MATVYIPPPLQSLSGGTTQLIIEATSVRQIIDRLETLYPGMKAALVDDDDLHPHIAVAVDGEVSVMGLVERVEEDSEVHFIPALGGGSGAH
jgi:molybdopterin synthase sulfur carrier subunit